MRAADLATWDAATWGAAAAWVTAAIYAVILIFAWRQVHEAKRLREEQTRPFVVVDFEVDWITRLVVENVGMTIARDVRLQFTPPLESTMSRPWPWEESTLFTDGIPTLVPKKRIVVHFDAINDRFDSSLPLSYNVQVTYRGVGRRRFEDRYTIDLEVYKGTTPPQGGMPELVEHLKSMRNEMKKWTGGVRGLRVNVTEVNRASRRTSDET